MLRRSKFCFLFIIVSSSVLMGQISFKEVASVKGINHIYSLGQAAGGISFVDFNNDGLDDLTMGTGKGELIHFYRNTGNGFVRNEPLIGNASEQKQILWSDFDNDGDQDLFVCSKGDVNRLYQNDGSLGMSDITESALLPLHSLNTFNACWADFNRDGWLDLYVCERVLGNQASNRNYLFFNNANGTFTEKTEDYGAGAESKAPFSSSAIDIDKDLWPDIYIANDRDWGNVLLKNISGESFEDQSIITDTNYEIDGMSIALGDYNNDSWIDMYISNSSEGNLLLKNNGFQDGNINFSNEAVRSNVSFNGTAWGSNFLDADNDMDLDLYVSGSDQGSDISSAAFYEQITKDSFSIIKEGFEKDTVISYANAIGDFNKDGLPDIAVINYNTSKSFLFENRSTGGNYIKLKLQGIISNKDGIGSSIELFVGSDYQSYYTHSGIGFLAQNSNTLNFGMAGHTSFDSIYIKWPTGHQDILYNVQANSNLILEEGSTTNNEIFIDSDIEIKMADFPSSYSESIKKSDFHLYPNPANNQIIIESSIEALSISIYNANGQEVQTYHSSNPFHNFTFKTASLSPGLYFIKLVGKDHTFQVQKVTIEH